MLLLIDIDEFKRINDTQGHAAGGRGLVDVARTITEELRPGDLVARLWGGEFAALLTDTAAVDVAAVADRIRRRVRLALLATRDLGQYRRGRHRRHRD